jgi:hypothetical protein
VPYSCIQSGGKWLCVKADNHDKVFGKHDSKGECEAQLRALYASENKKGK